MRITAPAERIAPTVAILAIVGVLMLSSLPGLAAGASPPGAPLVARSPGAGSHAGPPPMAAHPSTFTAVWSQLSIPGPSPRSYYGSAWDPQIGGLLIFGGCDGGAPWGESTFCGAMTNETWALIGNHWENLTAPVGPSARVLPMMAYDPTEDGVLLFGGGTGPASSNCLTDTWLYDYDGWQQLSPSTVPGCAQTGMDFDGNLGHILLLASPSGTDLSAEENVSWEFANGTWVQLSATSSFDRSNPMMFYDSTDKETVLFGGFDLSCGCQNLDDTWVFRQGAWTEIYPTQSPGARNEAAVTDDPSMGGLLMWGGHYAYVYYNDTWLFHNGSWTQLNTPVAPPYEWAMGMVTDPTTDRVILFGGYNFTDSVPQFSNQTWVFAFPSPFTAASLTAQPTSIFVGQEVELTPTVSGGLGELTYHYFGLPPGCTSLNTSLLLCVPTEPGDYYVQVNVTDQLGRFITATSEFSVGPAVVGPPLSLSAYFALPATVTEGGTLTLAVVTGGGSGGNSYRFAGLPGGCATVDSPSLMCVPTQVGTFKVQATVQDSGGASVEGNVTVTVQSPASPPPGPAVVSLSADPDPATVGELMALEVQTTGGVAPLSYSYTGLPAGCTSENASVVLCTPTAAGTSKVTVSVTDALGRGSEGNATATVAAAPAVGTPTGAGSSGGSSFGGIADSDLALAAVAAAVVAAGVAVVAVLRGRRPPAPPGPATQP